MYKQPKTSLKLPIALIVGPACCFIVASLLTRLNVALAPPPSPDNLFGDTPATPFLNIMAFVLGMAFIPFLPCLIIGIILLNKRLATRDRLRRGLS
jgi:hypothetical protein